MSRTGNKKYAMGFLIFCSVFCVLAPSLFMVGAAAQQSDRKLKSRVAPVYPELARKMGLTGTVKLQVLVSANGSVKDTKVIGGHPILVTSAVEAVKKWKFEPASAETTGTVEIKFDPAE